MINTFITSTLMLTSFCRTQTLYQARHFCSYRRTVRMKQVGLSQQGGVRRCCAHKYLSDLIDNFIRFHKILKLLVVASRRNKGEFARRWSGLVCKRTELFQTLKISEWSSLFTLPLPLPTFLTNIQMSSPIYCPSYCPRIVLFVADVTKFVWNDSILTMSIMLLLLSYLQWFFNEKWVRLLLRK